MYLSGNDNAARSEKTVWYFLIGWTILNALQAYTLELHADEAYYWVYSRFLDWGYYDHPPMVAIFIRLGYTLFHNEFGLRLLTVITSTLSVWILWLIIKQYNANWKLFILVIASTFIFHIYGFSTTPDAPLLFFTVLFYFFYKKYIDQDKWSLAVILAFVVAGLLYSKYHGILVIGLTVASNIKLLKRPSFWFIACLAAILYIPHILWQINHGFPSINYHLSERSSDEGFDISTVLGYIPGQVLMAGPFIGWFILYFAFTTRIKDTFIRCLLVNAIGTLAFFFLSTFKGNVQSHWTLVAYAPVVLLVLIHFKQRGTQPAWFTKLAIANIALILVIRIGLILGIPALQHLPHLESYFSTRKWVDQVKQRAGNSPVVIPDGFQEPSWYSFYTNSLNGFAYDSRYYRRTQYDIWPLEDSLQHKRVYCVSIYKLKKDSVESFNTSRGPRFGFWIDDFRSYQKILITTTSKTLAASPGQKLTFDLKINNPYSSTINFSNANAIHSVHLAACFFSGKTMAFAAPAGRNFNEILIKPHQYIHYLFPVSAPLQKGRYDLIFSIRTDPMPGGRNSSIINLTVQ